MKLWISLGAAFTAALAVASCGGLAFAVANAPALFGDFERHADIAYGNNARQHLDVYSPSKASGRPVIVFWYGGSWEQGKRSQYRFVGAALAEAGYVAVIPDYRLFPEARFPGFVDDGAAALAWVVRNAASLGGNPDRIYLAGHSAGAHLAAMLAYDPARLDRVGVPRAAIHGFIGLSGPYALNPNTDKLRTIFGAPYGFDDWQPVRLAKPGAPPALLLHGEADDVVDVAHARTFAKALEGVGVKVTLRVYEKREHRDTVAAFAVAAPDRLPVLAEIRNFIDAT